MANFKAIVFTANKTTVTANKYVPHALYVQNKALVEELGGEVMKGNGGFTAHFPSAVKAKAFISNAVCEMSKKEYNATRKSEPKKVVVTANAPKAGKGKSKGAVDFSKLAGKGRAANKDAALLIRNAGYTDGNSAEYKALWAEWCEVR